MTKTTTKKPLVVQWWILNRIIIEGKHIWDWWHECASKRDGLVRLRKLRAQSPDPRIWRLVRVEAWEVTQ